MRSVAVWAVAVVAASLAVVIGSPQAASAALPPGFGQTTAFSGLVTPTTLRFAPNGRVFVAEKRGTIQMFDGLNDTTPTQIADLRTEVYNGWDRGLLGLAVDPGFPARPYLYALYTYDGAINETAPKWGKPGVDSDPCPDPPGATTDGCVVSSKLVRLTLNSDNTTTKVDLVHDWCQQFSSHGAGSVVFGPDGALYATHGDGASFNYADYGQTKNPCGDAPGPAGTNLSAPTAQGGSLRAQDLRTPADPVTLDGSVIRVNPDTGAAMPDNPNIGATDPNARRIVAYGLRNPFRATIRPGTGELWLADVGWNTWEEIDRLPDPKAGQTNFGWPCYEGSPQNQGFANVGLDLCKNLYAATTADRKPFYSYQHGTPLNASDPCVATSGSSISGVAFGSETGSTYPAQYNGALFFSDYSRGCIWVMSKGASGLPDPATATPFLSAAAVDLVMSPQGELFYPDIAAGTIQRIVYGGASTCPTGQYRAEYFPNVDLSGPAASTACEAAPLNHDWGTATPPGVGPNNFSARWTGSFAVGTAGTYTFTAVADDGIRVWVDGTPLVDEWHEQATGTTFTAPRYLSAGPHQVKTEWYNVAGPPKATLDWAFTGTNAPPQPQIATPAAGTTWKVGDPISFSGSASDTEDGVVPSARLSWEVDMEHCPTGQGCHTHILETDPGVAGGSFAAPDHSYPSYLMLRLTATDLAGQSVTVTRRLDPRTVPLTVVSKPSGLRLGLGDATGVSPLTRRVIVGGSTALVAASPQSLAGATYRFTRWSDGGGQAHNIIAGAVAATYTATFTLTACPTGQFRAQYFANQTFTGAPAVLRCEVAPVNKAWGTGGPVGSVVDRFSARWTGSFSFPGGSKTFTAVSDDGVRVWLDGVQIINRWTTGAGTSRATRTVAAGVHTVRIDYFESTGTAAVKVTW